MKMKMKMNLDLFNETISLEEHERQKCEIWTRVMGYHRPISEFNLGKKGEQEERTCFVENVVM